MPISGSGLGSRVVAALEIDTGDTTRYQVYESLSSAQRYLLNALPAELLFDLIKEDLDDLVSGDANYDYPTDMMRVVSLHLDYDAEIDADNEGVLATIYDPKRFVASMQNLATKSYPYVKIKETGGPGGGYRIAPIPTAAQTDGRRLLYIQKPADITSGVDAEIDARFEDLLVWYAIGISANVDNYRPEMAKQHMDIFKNELKTYLPNDF